MEKKKMTREQAIELLKNRKVYVNGKSAEIQKKLFELGFEWAINGKEVIYENWPFLYTSDTKRIQSGNDMVNFSRAKNTEISSEEIISIELEPDCPFKLFDKVLVRDGYDEEWMPALFWEKTINNAYPYLVISGQAFNQCISYEGHEHLLGTTKSPEE